MLSLNHTGVMNNENVVEFRFVFILDDRMNSTKYIIITAPCIYMHGEVTDFNGHALADLYWPDVTSFSRRISVLFFFYYFTDSFNRWFQFLTANQHKKLILYILSYIT